MEAFTKNVFRLSSSIVAMVALIGATSPAEAKSGTAIAKTIKGSATYTDQIGRTLPLSVGTVLEEGWTVQTGAGSSVDLFLEHNGPYVGLFADTTLKLNRLRYEPGELGNVIETEFDLPRGEMLAHVNKLLAGARYEVISPRGVAKVRGTSFWWSMLTGEIHTVTGTVLVELTILNPGPGGDPAPNSGADYKRTITVESGKSFFVPQQIQLSTFLGAGIAPFPRPVPLHPSVVTRLQDSFPAADFFDDGGSTSTKTVTELFQADYIDVEKKKVRLKFGATSPTFSINSP